MKVVQFSPSDSRELPARSNFLLERIVRSQTVFSIRECFLSSLKSCYNAFQTMLSHEFHGFTRILPIKRQTFVLFVSFAVI